MNYKTCSKITFKEGNHVLSLVTYHPALKCLKNIINDSLHFLCINSKGVFYEPNSVFVEKDEV